MPSGRTLVLLLLASASLLGPSLMPAPEGRAELNALLAEFRSKLTALPAPRALGQGAAALADLEAALTRVQDSVNAGGAELSPEERRLLADLRAGRSDLQAPVLNDLKRRLPLLANSPDFSVNSLLRSVQKLWAALLERLRFWMWALPALTLGLGVAALAASQTGAVRALAGFGQSLASPWLALLAMSAAGLAVVTRGNPWAAMPAHLYVPPVLWLLGSAELIRRIDQNQPFWNSVLSGLLPPVLSMGFVLTLPRLLPLLPPIPGL